MELERLLLVVAALLVSVAPAAAVNCRVPADRPTIVSALGDSGCDPIIIASGTYNEGPLTVSRSVTIQGPNVGIPGTAPREAEATITGASDGFRLSAGTITIDGLQIAVAAGAVVATGTPTGVTVANSVISGNVGVTVATTGGILFDANLVTATGIGIGLEVRSSGAAPVVVRDNVIEGAVNTQGGTSVLAAGINVQNAGGPVSITTNTVTGARVGLAATFMNAYGIQVITGMSGAVVADNSVSETGCDFDGCTAYGIFVFATFGSGGPIDVRGNAVVGTHAVGVASINSANGIFALTDGALQASGNTVRLTLATSNSIASAAGLQAFSDSPSVPATVTDNRVITTLASSGTSIATANGLIAGRDADVVATGNDVQETYGVGPTGDGAAVTAFSFERSATAANNTVVGVDGAGVLAAGAVDASATGNRVSKGASPGVSVGGGTGTGLAEGNVVLDATGAGIILTSGYMPATVLRAHGNHVERAGGPALRISNLSMPFTGTVDVSGNTALDSASGVGIDSTIEIASAASVSARFNRIVGNEVGIDHLGKGFIGATDNWWGCNEGPGQPGCDGVVVADSVNASVDADPWLTLRAIAPTSSAPDAVAVAGDLTLNSDGQATSSEGTLPDETSVGFATTLGTLSPPAAGTVDGVARSTLSSDAAGMVTVTVSLDNASASTSIDLKANELLSGKRLLLKNNPLALQLLSKDRALTLGDGNGSGDDPTVNNGSLRLRSSVGGVVLFDVTHALPAARWKRIGREGTNKGYVLRNAPPVGQIVVKAGKMLKITGKGAFGFALDASPDPVDVVLTLGKLRYCMSFGGRAKFQNNKRYLATNAPAPSACPPGN